MSNPISFGRHSSSSSSPMFPSSITHSRREEDLINAYEAEEERIINVLSRKLEILREEKVNLENALEAESESHVLRLSRELSSLRVLQQQQQQQQQNSDSAGPSSLNRATGVSGFTTVIPSGASDPRFPAYETMLEAIRRENETLRNRLVDTERAFIRVTRLNEIYREELIDHRRRLGLPVDSLIGLQSSQDPLSQPTHRRPGSGSSSPASSAIPLPQHRTTPVPVPVTGLPIPRPPSRPHAHRPPISLSGSSTPLTTSPSSSPSSPFSPMQSGGGLAGASSSSYLTQYTTPPSSTSPLVHHPFPHAPPSLSYPSVPPPSLSSSLGSPVTMFQPIPPSPTVPLSRRSSTSQTQNPNSGINASHITISRRMSVERGARVAETGSLRDRRSSGTTGTMFGSGSAGMGSSSASGGSGPRSSVNPS